MDVCVCAGGRALCQLQVAPLQNQVFVSRGVILFCGAGPVSPPGPEMTTKIIHFMVNGKLEQAELGAGCSADDVKGERGPRLIAPHKFGEIIGDLRRLLTLFLEEYVASDGTF